ncbi:MAG TPA: HAD family hydrolase [Polyangiaceae bacterium]|nr:HAD family hydrolase [Polyangiaceae bacterium]
MTFPRRPTTCTGCGAPLDAARAAAVRFDAVHEYFFCSVAHAEAFRFDAPLPARPTAPARSTAPSAAPPVGAPPAATAPNTTPPAAIAPAATERLLPAQALSFEAAADGAWAAREPAPFAEPAFDPSAGAPLDAASVAPPNLDTNTTVDTAPRRPALRAQAILRLGPAFLAAVAFVRAAREGTTLTGSAWLVFVLLASAVVQERLAEWLERATVTARGAVRARLDVPAHRLRDGQLELLPASEIRPGEELSLGPNEVLGVDGVVVEGAGTVEPWPGARVQIAVGPASRLLAGARVVDGNLRVTCTASGSQRAWVPLVERGPRRLDRSLPAARFAARAGLLGAPLAGAAGGTLAYLLGATSPVALDVAAAVWGALSGALLLHLPAELGARRLLALSRAGIFFPHSSLLENAGQVSTVVLCARGTVLHGEPEVAEIESLRGESVERVLALAAGAESVVAHPIASAVVRAAMLRGVTPDAARHHHPTSGLGVVCVSSRGAPLVVGSRELLLRERVSIAVAEEALRRFESQGKTALLVAEDHHLLGALSLIDGLRAGARATVERLLVAGFEPVLLSGDSRRTTEAVGHALGIDHLRPEVVTGERGLEVARLSDGGAVVAVFGRPGFDDTALAAARVPLVLGLPPTSLRDRAIGVASERPLDAAWALAVCRDLAQRTWSGVLLAFVPAALVSVAAASLLVPPWLAPLVAALAAGVSSTWLLRRGPDSGRADWAPPAD